MTNSHRKKFFELADTPGNWIGGNPAQWHRQIFGRESQELPEKSVNRQQVKDLCDNPRVAADEAFSAVMAWGGMNRRFGKKAAETFGPISTIVTELRTGRIDRRRAYDMLRAARKEGHLKGIGPSYFTKMIFFLAPQHNGYILDQWSAKSMNLLMDRELIPIKIAKQEVKGKTQLNVAISERVDGQLYEEFCRAVEALAQVLSVSPDLAELRLFGGGGRGAKRSRWRQYVVDHYPVDGWR